MWWHIINREIPWYYNIPLITSQFFMEKSRCCLVKDATICSAEGPKGFKRVPFFEERPERKKIAPLGSNQQQELNRLRVNMSGIFWKTPIFSGVRCLKKKGDHVPGKNVTWNETSSCWVWTPPGFLISLGPLPLCSYVCSICAWDM